MFNGVNDEIIFLLDDFKERFEDFVKCNNDECNLYFYLIIERLNLILKIIELNFSLLLDND